MGQEENLKCELEGIDSDEGYTERNNWGTAEASEPTVV
jgi:hypothetical protein